MINSSSFAPVIHELVHETGNLTAAYIYGYVWINRDRDGVFDQATDTIASLACLAKSTVKKWLKWLVIHDYLDDLTPDEQSRPHRYICTDKATIHTAIEFKAVIHKGAEKHEGGGPRNGPQGVTKRPPRGLQNDPMYIHDIHDDDEKNIATLFQYTGLDAGALPSLLKIYADDVGELARLVEAWSDAVVAEALPQHYGPGLIYTAIKAGEYPPERPRTFADEVAELMAMANLDGHE